MMEVPTCKGITRCYRQEQNLSYKIKSGCRPCTKNFYQSLNAANSVGAPDWIPKARAGRLLRSPSLFKDIVKMICTTNCSWSATQRMVQNLVQKLGTRYGRWQGLVMWLELTREWFETTEE